MTTKSLAIACVLSLLAPLGAAAQDTNAVLVGQGQSGGLLRALSAADGSELASATPFGANFQRGVRVASGDITGDGTPDFIAGEGGNGGQVKVIDGASLAVVWTFS